MATLSDRLDHLLGKKTADALEEAFDIRTVEDLLRHYPHRYASQGRELAEKDPPEGEHITIIARVTSAAVVKMKNRPGSMLKVVLSTDTQNVDVTFFSPQKVKHVIKPGVRAMFSGTVKYFRQKWSLTHPSYLILPEPRAGSEDPVVKARSTSRSTWSSRATSSSSCWATRTATASTSASARGRCRATTSSWSWSRRRPR